MTPLAKRLPRELRHDLGKYLGLFFLIVLLIAFISGYLAAARSIQSVIADTRAQSLMEDFSFTTQFALPDELRAQVEDLTDGVVIDNWSADVPLALAGSDSACTVRLFKNRTDVDLASYLEGCAPAAADEIALDRVFMSNNGLAVGDQVEVGGQPVTIVGAVCLPDYQALVQKSTDMIFNALTFTIAQVTPEGYDAMAGEHTVWRYAVRLADPSLSLIDRTSLEGDVANALSDGGALLTDLVDRETNAAMTFADDDLEGDQLMWEFLLGILLVVVSFAFVVLTNASIDSQSAVIGTLLALGYRKRELLGHYLTLPLVVGIAAAIVGNVVGYGILIRFMADLYYGSYGLPPFRVTFDVQTFVLTTVVPLVVLVAVTLAGLAIKLRATPLAFLRHEVGTHSRLSAVRLPDRWSFATRFRLRVFLRNASHFAVLFVGIIAVTLLFIMGLCMMPMVAHYADQASSDLPANHLYMLKAPLEIDASDEERDNYAALETLITTENPLENLSMRDLLQLGKKASQVDLQGNAVNVAQNTPEAIGQAEKFGVSTLVVARRYSESDEEVSVYGVSPDSRYWTDMALDASAPQAATPVVVGAGLVEKCQVELGVPFEMRDRFTGDSYLVVATSTWGSDANVNVYLSLDAYNEMFGNAADFFNGYASDLPLNLDERFLALELTPEQMHNIANQMESSMGAVMRMVTVLALAVSFVLIYLLTKTVIDRSARYVSYMKVFGYRNHEIDRLYVRPITITVLASLVVSLPIDIWLIKIVVNYMMAAYAGNFAIYIGPVLVLEVLALGIGSYAAVALLHLRKVRRVPISLAMRTAE